MREILHRYILDLALAMHDLLSDQIITMRDRYPVNIHKVSVALYVEFIVCSLIPSF